MTIFAILEAMDADKVDVELKGFHSYLIGEGRDGFEKQAVSIQSALAHLKEVTEPVVLAAKDGEISAMLESTWDNLVETKAGAKWAKVLTIHEDNLAKVKEFFQIAGKVKRNATLAESWKTLAANELLEFTSSANNGDLTATTAEPVTTGNAHANRKADKAENGEKNAETMDTKNGPTDKKEVITWALQQLSMTDGDASQALYNSLVAQWNNRAQTGNEAAARSIVTKESVDDLFSADGVELSEDFRDRAFIMFEAAVASKVIEIEESLQADYEEKLEEATDELTTKIDEFMDYVAESWLKANEAAVVSTLRAELAENFLNGLRDLFATNYVMIPEDKENIVEELAAELEAATEKTNEAIAESIELKKTVQALYVEKAFDDLSEGLTETQKENLWNIVEKVDYATVEEFSKKVKIIKENTFASGTKKVLTEGDTLSAPVETSTEEVTDVTMKGYLSALSRTIRK